MAIWRLFRLLCLILLALLLPNQARADEGVCDPEHLPRPQRYTFTERGVEAVVEVRAICWREEWSVSMHVDLLVKEGEILLPPNVFAFNELGHEMSSRDGLGGVGMAGSHGASRAKAGDRRAFVAEPIGAIRTGWLLHSKAAFTIHEMDGSASSSRGNIDAWVDTRRWPPRLRAAGLRSRVGVQTATWVAGRDLSCPRGTVMLAADLGTRATSCMELHQDARETGFVAAIPDDYGGLRCPDNTLLRALEGDKGCVAVERGDRPINVGGGRGHPDTVPSDRMGRPGPSIPHCPNEDLAIAFDVADPQLLRCTFSSVPLSRERWVRRTW